MAGQKALDPLHDRLAARIEASAVDLLDPARLEAQAEDMRLIRSMRFL
jgi:hypothetical protein